MRTLGWHRFVSVSRSGLLRQTAVLFLVDTAANLVDYVYHVYLGRTLVPGDFGAFQALNSILLVVITAAGVLQPVVARFVAEDGSGHDGSRTGSLTGGSAAFIRSTLAWSALAGLSLALVAWLGREFLSDGLNLPVFAVTLGALVLVLVFLRPVVAGALQGAQRFIAYGAVRLTFALGRFGVAAVLVSMGWGLLGAVVSLPAGQLLAVGFGLALLGAGLWKITPSAPRVALRKWLPLVGWAFLAYGTYAALIHMDLVYVNQNLSSAQAGIYAAGVLLRRILLLLPGAAVIVMYPRVAAGVVRKVLPDPEIRWAAGLVSGVMAVLVGIYFLAGESIVRMVFGEAYTAVGPLIGWMGFGIWGYSLGTVWMNVFLATRPGPFTGVLIGLAVLQAMGLLAFGVSLPRVVAIFSAVGWLLALAGWVLYAGWLRPGLVRQFISGADE